MRPESVSDTSATYGRTYLHFVQKREPRLLKEVGIYGNQTDSPRQRFKRCTVLPNFLINVSHSIMKMNKSWAGLPWSWNMTKIPIYRPVRAGWFLLLIALLSSSSTLLPTTCPVWKQNITYCYKNRKLLSSIRGAEHTHGPTIRFTAVYDYSWADEPAPGFESNNNNNNNELYLYSTFQKRSHVTRS